MNFLDKIRLYEGNDILKAKFNLLYEENPSLTLSLINDSELSFTSLYILKDEKCISNLALSQRNQHALNFCYKLNNHNVLEDGEVDYALVKWIFQTGYLDDGLSNEFDNIIDIVSSLLVINFEDHTILPFISHIIFKRNRMKAFNLYLIWVFFMSGNIQSLFLIANKILSDEEQDVIFARKLLNFIPIDKEAVIYDKSELYENYLNWIQNNREKIFFIGESFQFSSEPAIFQIHQARPAIETVATVRGVNIDFETLMNEYPSGSIEQTILQKIHSGNGRYNYDSLDQLRFEIKMRKEIIKASVALYNSGMGFEVFRNARANPDFWTVTEEGGFLLRNDVKPSDAIKDFYKNGRRYGTECATAMVIIYYMALFNIFPEDLFNSVFENIHLMNWHYIDRNLREIGLPRPVSEFIPGDRLYANNPDVNPQTPQWQGENLIYLDDDTYYGHGIGMGNVDYFIKQLNQNRKKDADESAYLMTEASRPNFKKLAEIYYNE